MRLIARAFIVFFKQFFQTLAKMLAFTLALVALIVMIGASSAETPSLDQEVTFDYLKGNQFADNSLLYVPIHGVILTEEETDSLSSLFETQITYGYEIKEVLQAAAKKDEIKGVYLHIDSPGGTVTGAKAISDGIAMYRQQTGKPVYAYISGMAASGGYWAATAAEKIYADSGTSIGSIGVIFGPFKYYDTVISEDGGLFVGGVVTEKGIQTTYITAGRSKDIGNPYRQLTDQELATLQESVDDVYGVFVDQVATSRGVTVGDVRDGYGAMIYSEQQAVERRMIDGIGTREVVEQALIAKTGLASDDVQFVTVGINGGVWESLMGVVNRWAKPNRIAVTGCPLSRVMMAYHGDVSAFCK